MANFYISDLYFRTACRSTCLFHTVSVSFVGRRGPGDCPYVFQLMYHQCNKAMCTRCRFRSVFICFLIP